MEILYNDAEHRYWLKKDGEQIEVPSITQSLSPLNNLSGIDPGVLDRAARRGTDVHYACELIEGGGDGTGLCREALDPKIAGYVAGWERFLSETGWKSSKLEWMVGSWRYKVAGRLDRIGYFSKGPLSIVEIKTTSSPSPKDPVQLAGQELLARETDPDIAKQKKINRYVVYLAADGIYKLRPCKDESDVALFLSCVAIANFRRKHYET